MKWRDQEHRQKTPPIMTGIPRVQLRIRGRRASIDSSNTIERISQTIRTNRHTGLGNQSPIRVSNAFSIVQQVPRESFERTNVNAIRPPPFNHSKFYRHRPNWHQDQRSWPAVWEPCPSALNQGDPNSGKKHVRAQGVVPRISWSTDDISRGHTVRSSSTGFNLNSTFSSKFIDGIFFSRYILSKRGHDSETWDLSSWRSARREARTSHQLGYSTTTAYQLLYYGLPVNTILIVLQII